MEEALMRVTIFALIMAAAATTALAQAPDLQFRAAQQKETVEGDLTSAIKLYASVADSKTTPPALAARALVGLGRCYERLGSTEAPKAYERVVAQFGKEEAAALICPAGLEAVRPRPDWSRARCSAICCR
jgi:TolA-binding protein